MLVCVHACVSVFVCACLCLPQGVCSDSAVCSMFAGDCVTFLNLKFYLFSCQQQRIRLDEEMARRLQEEMNAVVRGEQQVNAWNRDLMCA